jgi:hypothetical protein
MSLKAELTSYMIHLVNVTEKAYVDLKAVMCATKHFTQSVILANWQMKECDKTIILDFLLNIQDAQLQD